MIVDSSVLVTLVLGEPEAEYFRSVLNEQPRLQISAPSLLETSIVLGRRTGFKPSSVLQNLIAEFRIEVVPFTEQHAALALEAYALYGKGRAHRAQLNFGDCMSYALARETAEPLLFKGDDFPWTDVPQP